MRRQLVFVEYRTTQVRWTDGQETSFSGAETNGGWNLQGHWNGNSPLAELVRVLWAYYTHRSCLDQDDG